MSAAVIEKEISDHRLTTDRLELRVVSMDDFDHYFHLMSDPGVMKYIGVEAGKLFTTEEITSLLDGAVTAWRTRGYGRWSVFDRETNEFVGFVGFRCEGGVPEFIVLVHERYWGNGYATEAAHGALDYGFTSLGFKVVCAFTRPANRRARTLLKRVGAEFVGEVNFHGVNGSAYRIHPNRN